ncbi:site-specific recombinase XerD [Nitrosomonas oligotropha]|uniref:Site-specific recombinase XerD n=1 Tax=Nitrosomonas oligotropha TaxID=42354 RepID=A0A2T5HYT8_9PROT|nr:site-specific integrase [Nitrosomonas oligotropha]PTQ76743.1 site-specific recombinase XerD [Nitrosomonas oligotropha]
MSKFNFTKSSIDSLPLPADGKRATYHDASPKGIGLQMRVSSTGAKTFCVFKRVKGGNPERVTLGRYPEMTIEQARRKSSEILLQIASGNNPAEIERQRKAEQTFHDLFGEYLEKHSKPRKKTWCEDEANYRLYINEPLGRKKLSVINRQDIAKIHHRITKAGHNAQANRVIALLSSVFNWGISVDLCSANPAHGIKRNKEESRDRYIQSDELPKFFKAVADEPNETIRDYVLVSLLTGARRSNVLAMRWQDISFDRHEWRIKETKNGTPQTVALSPEAIQILENRKPDDHEEFVFPGSGKSEHLEEPKKGWKRILERAGISDLRIHDLRRTLGSWQANLGASLPIIGKSLNHKSHASTLIYARLHLDPVRDSVNKASSAMLAAAEVKQSANSTKIKGTK